MSRLICSVTLAISGTVTAAIWCLGLAVRRTSADVKETMLHGIGYVLSRTFRISLYFFLARRAVYATRDYARRISLASLARQWMRSRHCSDGCQLCFSHCSVRANKIVYLQCPGAGARPSRFSIRAHSSRTTPQSHLVSFLLDPSDYIRESLPPQSPR
jgi:hypothetical protein